MSARAVTWAHAQSTGNAARKAVLVALADMADEAHSCWPPQAMLATMTEQSARSVRRHLSALEEAGLIIRAHRGGAAGGRTSDRYTLPVSVAVSVSVAGKPKLAANLAGNPRLAANLAARNRVESDTLPANLAGNPPDNLAGNPELAANLAGEVLKAFKVVNVPTERNAVVKSGAAKKRRGTRLPADWLRTDTDREWQAGKGIPDDFAREHTAAFRDYWTAVPGARGVKLDWSATWRNWMRREWGSPAGDRYRRAAGQAPGFVDFETQREQARLDRARRAFANTDPLASAR